MMRVNCTFQYYTRRTCHHFWVVTLHHQHDYNNMVLYSLLKLIAFYMVLYTLLKLIASDVVPYPLLKLIAFYMVLYPLLKLIAFYMVLYPLLKLIAFYMVLYPLLKLIALYMVLYPHIWCFILWGLKKKLYFFYYINEVSKLCNAYGITCFSTLLLFYCCPYLILLLTHFKLFKLYHIWRLSWSRHSHGDNISIHQLVNNLECFTTLTSWSRS